MKHLGHTYGGFIPAISERGMTPSIMCRPILDLLLTDVHEPPVDLGWDPISVELVETAKPTIVPCNSPVDMQTYGSLHGPCNSRYLTAF
jgi:hypothetical protein